MESKTTKAKLFQNQKEWEELMKELSTCSFSQVETVQEELARVNRERNELVLKSKDVI